MRSFFFYRCSVRIRLPSRTFCVRAVLSVISTTRSRNHLFSCPFFFSSPCFFTPSELVFPPTLPNIFSSLKLPLPPHFSPPDTTPFSRRTATEVASPWRSMIVLIRRFADASRVSFPSVCFHALGPFSELLHLDSSSNFVHASHTAFLLVLATPPCFAICSTLRRDDMPKSHSPEKSLTFLFRSLHALVMWVSIDFLSFLLRFLSLRTDSTS